MNLPDITTFTIFFFLPSPFGTPILFFQVSSIFLTVFYGACKFSIPSSGKKKKKKLSVLKIIFSYILQKDRFGVKSFPFCSFLSANLNLKKPSSKVAKQYLLLPPSVIFLLLLLHSYFFFRAPLHSLKR